MSDPGKTVPLQPDELRRLIERAHQEWMAALDVVHDPIFLHDREFRILRCNRAYQQCAGLPFKDIVGRTYYHSFPKTDGPLHHCLQAMENPGVEFEEELSINGDVFRSRSVAITDEEGAYLYSIHTLEDITGRKRMEESLVSANALLQSVVENAPVRIFWKDVEFRYLGCNTAFARDAGHSSPDEVIGKTDFEMVWKDQAELYRADDMAVMESGKPKLDIEEPQTTPDGNTVWLRTSKVPLRDESKQVIGILGIYQDITERKKSESLLRLSAQLLDSSADSIMAFDLDGNFIYLNEAAWKTRGYTRDELMALNLHALDVPAYEKFIEVKIGELMVKGSNIFEAAHRCKDGSIIPVEVSSRIIESDGRKVIISASRDITERKRAEADLAEQLEELRRWHDTTMGREGRVLELKHEVNDLLSQTGKNPRYPSAESPDTKKE